jgi:hypothetical protein
VAPPELFAGLPGEIGSGVVAEPARHTQIQVDVAVSAPAVPGEPRRMTSAWPVLLGYRGGMSREAWIAIAVLGGILAVATLIGAIVLAVRVWRTRKMLGELGAGGKVAFYGALAYTIFPVDVLPDPIYLDDMGILAGALLYLTHLVRRQRAARPVPPGPAGRHP